MWERASGAPPDPRADVWSLGLVLRDLIDARPDPSLPGIVANANDFSANRVLVLPLADESADAELASFGVLAAGFVTEAIAATPFAEAVPAITALAIARDGTVAPPGVDRLVHRARPVGAAWVIASAYVVQGDSLLVRAALASGRDGRVVRTLRTVTVPRRAPAEALDALARTAVGVTALELDPRVRTDPLRPASPPRWDACQADSRGKEHFLARRYAEADAAFDEAYARDSSLRFPLFYQGIASVNTGNWERLAEGVTAYRRRQEARSDPMERIALGVLESFLSGDHAARYRLHREAESLGMISPGGLGHFSMGVAALDVGRPRETVTNVRQSDPDRGELEGWPGYHDALATAPLVLGDADAALDAARRLQADHPAIDLGSRRAMEAFAAQGRLAALDSVLASALQSVRHPDDLLRFAGHVLRLTGHDTAARQYYTRAVTHAREALLRASGADTTNARFALAESLLLAGELAEAEQLFRALAVERPTLMDPVAALGRIAARRGDRATVATIDSVLAERATRRFNLGAATYRRARLAAALGDGERAARLLEQAWREGSTIYQFVRTDPEFAPVRGHAAMRARLAPKG
jgi:tetratricopeptide (TPR) repeat protein